MYYIPIARFFDYDSPLLLVVDDDDDDDDDDDEDDETKSCFKSTQNRICCSLRYFSTYIGTPNVRVKVLWVCESPELRFFLRPKVTKFTLDH